MRMIDEGMLLVLRAANGAYSCRAPPIPKYWNPIDRPHVAVLVPTGSTIMRVFLSKPAAYLSDSSEVLEVSDLDVLPEKSIIEVRNDTVEYNYYRKDNNTWTKVAESSSPFMVEVFSHGTTPIVLDVVNV
jgi:hypothetical protein